MWNEHSTAATHHLWRNALPETRARLHLLQRAADDLQRSRTIDQSQCKQAAATAHDLASALSLFGMREAAALARDVEATLDHDGLPQPERLHEQVHALAAALETRIHHAD